MGWQVGIERRISMGRCSHCGATRLYVTLRCQVTHNACLGTVRCEACGATVEVSTGAHPDGPQPDLHEWMVEFLCGRVVSSPNAGKGGSP